MYSQRGHAKNACFDVNYYGMMACESEASLAPHIPRDASGRNITEYIPLPPFGSGHVAAGEKA
jgi:hypothetical protein